MYFYLNLAYKMARKMGEAEKIPGSKETKERRTALLNKHNPTDIIEGLPPAVFPVTCRFSIPRATEQDESDSEYAQPQYPVNVQRPQGVYIPETTVHFDNPARRAPDGKSMWSPTRFIEKFQDVLDDHDGLDVDAVLLSRLTVVEVPQHLVTTDSETGEPIVKPELYSDEKSMTLARFEKHASLSATHVRNEIAEALPGESRTPTRLTDLIEVTAKPSRHGTNTTAEAGRNRYYTDAEAEKTNELSRTPSHYQAEFVDRSSREHRPLGPAVSSLSDFTPELVSNADDLLRVVKFVGYEKESRSLVATEVLT